MSEHETETDTESKTDDKFSTLFKVTRKLHSKLFASENMRLMVELKLTDKPRYMKLMHHLRELGLTTVTLRELQSDVNGRAKAVQDAARSAGAGSEETVDPSPLPIARRFREAVHPTLLWFQDEWLLYRGSHYDAVEPALVKRDVYAFAEKLGLAPHARLVGDIIDALKGLALVERGTYAPPCWLEGGAHYPADEILSCRNGLLHLPSGKLLPATPRFFTRNALPYDYDPEAPEPKVWLKFLDDLWDEDPEQITLLQEVMGLLLTPDTSMQKFFMLIGPTRGGKGVIIRTIGRLLGSTNICSPDLSDFGQRFGLSKTLGKTVATVSDMRLGQRADKQGLVGNLLRIVGEDDVDVERKYIDGAWTGKLNIRILIATNLMPSLPDASGALAARLVALHTTKSFLGREDRTLERRMSPELPGILNWAIVGWRRLKEQGDFTDTEACRLMVEKMRDQASPLNAFLRDCCVLDPNAKTPKTTVYARYLAYMAEEGKDDPYGTSNNFHRDLQVAAQYRISDSRPREEGDRVRHWEGLRLVACETGTDDPLG